MSRTTTIIEPTDDGRRMSLEEFDLAEAREGRRYELSRGVITVTDVPDRRHMFQVLELRRQLTLYSAAHPGQIHALPGGGECKILVAELESERHPDLSVYKTAPPDGRDMWAHWIPEIVIEVVSPSSARRDYEEKPPEYLAFGVLEYWIVDADRREILVMRRSRGRWAQRIVKPPEFYLTHLLPDFNFDCAAVFAAADAAGPAA